MPMSNAGATAGNAARFATIVTPGTSWKWNSRIGVTPSCAARVVPAASAIGLGITRASRSASGVASATMPPVAATLSWNPIDHTSQGSSARSTRTAPARMDAVARGRPMSTPTSVKRGHDAGAHHRGFGAGEHHEERDRAQREQEPRPTRETHPRGERQHGCQDHGDVLAAHHQQVAEPGRVEVAREPGIELGVVAEHQPQQQAGFLRREEPGDRGAHERAEHLRGADERVRCPAQPLVLAELDGDRDAFVVQHVREPGIVGDLERAFEQDPVAAHRPAGEVLTRR